MINDKKTAIIMGGGLAGLTIATELADAGYKVSVLEKNSYLGGRASNTIDKETGDPVPIGPHIFLKGYGYLRQFLEKIGAKEDIVWERKLFIELIYKNQHYQFRMKDMPISLFTLHKIFKYPFVSFWDLLTNIKFSLKLHFYSTNKFEKIDDINAYDYLIKQGISKNSIDKMWRFFTLSMLNLPVEKCSAAELCLLAKYWASVDRREIGFAKVGLGDIYTQKANEYIESKGGTIHTEYGIKKIVSEDDTIKHLVVDSPDGEKNIKADLYISSLNPIQLREVLPNDILSNNFFKGLGAFEGVPYISVNLWFNKKISNKKFWALLNDSAKPENMNLDFYDKSNIYESRKDTSYIASNIIYSKAYESMSDKEIIDKTLLEIREVFPRMDAKIVHSHVHRLPYVIYALYPGMRKHKLSNKTPVSNFYLAGDWTNKEMTQSMESAVQSGYQCAKAIQKVL
jgi:uncharacterized protein with NAD-binding domain and iron-sulfur cluster